MARLRTVASTLVITGLAAAATLQRQRAEYFKDRCMRALDAGEALASRTVMVDYSEAVALALKSVEHGSAITYACNAYLPSPLREAVRERLTT